MAADGVLVVVDLDDEHRTELEQRLEAVVQASQPLRVVIKLAIEELEAFYLGDLRALEAAFPMADMAIARSYIPDSIVGTAELFGRIIGDDGLRKVMWADKMGAQLATKPSRSRSPSFKALHAGIRDLVSTTAAPKARRKKHWKSRHSSQRKKGAR